MWTRNEQGRWTRWTDTGRCLDALARSPRAVAHLVVLGHPSGGDDDEVCSTIRLAIRLAPGPLEVVVGSSAPSASWLEAVRQAGAHLTLLVAEDGRGSDRGSDRGRDSGHDDPPLKGAAELDARICPALHARHAPRMTLSVCGRHADRMVLGRHHLERWCLAARQGCPHWRGGSRE